ncbi:uncharacterized protein LY89DRAFT_776104 [Mollisia scopiformis]|uniref:Peptidase C14 caspase domain-containing protein n=1 Tax=Mollisia scopiformis TaxID=149040 RepID=A0A194XUS6_MOLSC|nr:uncharacterized protein LY89DRAFT_776104 [Mollisia scopiformis]KUJ23891.1 hypothetical protein LY89DRAFT_776104 [Mollisia scopiformis]
MDERGPDQIRLASESSVTTVEKDSQDSGFIRLWPAAHDISCTEFHIPNIHTLGADLDAAVQAVWPTRHQSRYTRVCALLVSWEDDDLGVWREVGPLRSLLKDKYNFDVEEYRIPSVKTPDKALKSRVIDFLDADEDDTLFIFYYAGHARRALDANNSTMWCANRRSFETVIASGGIQSMFEEAEADVLLLYDCCYSAAGPITGSGRKRHVVEAIAACGYETIAPEVDKHSFTKALTEMLARKLEGGSFSVGELHSRVLSKLKCWTPDLRTDEYGKFLETRDGHFIPEHQPRRTPIYSIICETEPRRSILLAPLPKREFSSTPSASDGPDTPSSSSPGPVPWDIPAPSTNLTSKKRKRNAEHKAPTAQILLAIRLERDALDIPQWTELLRNLPSEAIDIRIEGVYQSFSTLLLLRMPVAVWDLLPQNPAYSFVGFVTSDNLSHRVKRTPTLSVPPEECHSVHSASQKSEDEDEDVRHAGQVPAGRRTPCDTEILTDVEDTPRGPAKRRGRPYNQASNRDSELLRTKNPPVSPPVDAEASQTSTSSTLIDSDPIEFSQISTPIKKNGKRCVDSPRSPSSVASYGWVQVWFCCQCDQTDSDPAAAIGMWESNCANCGHSRDGGCKVDQVKVYESR